MMATMKLYDGNWLLLHDYLKRSLGDRQFETVYEEPEVVVMTEEKIVAEPKENIYTLDNEFETIIEEPALPAQDDDLSKGFVFEQVPYKEDPKPADNDETLILPVYTEDYFLHQGVQVSNDIPEEVDKVMSEEEAKSLMVVMSFAEWLNHFKTSSEKAREEEEDQKALKTMWQKEKLVAALEEENEEIPENVFQMAVNSIAKE